MRAHNNYVQLQCGCGLLNKFVHLRLEKTIMSSILELPHTSSGEIDWTTLGNMLCAHIMGEVLCASYLDRAHRKKEMEADVEPETDWKFVYKEDEVVAFHKVFKDSPIHAFMGRGIIERPIEEIVDFLETHERRKEWDRYLVEIKQIKALSETDVILYMHMEATNCFIKQQRDFLHFERMAYYGEKYVRSAISVELPEVPHKPHIIRGELRPGTGWVLEPYRGSRTCTLVSYLAHIDLKGLPPLITNRVMRRQPKAISRIRKILSKRKADLPKHFEDSQEESFTTSEKKAAVHATMDYQSHLHNQDHYEQDISIEEFIGTRDRRYQSIPPKLKYDPGTDSFKGSRKGKIGRSFSLDSAGVSGVPQEMNGSCRSRASKDVLGDLDAKWNRSGGITKSCDSGGDSARQVLHADLDLELTASKKEGEEQDIMLEMNLEEFPIDSNPVIRKSTGFEGDSELPFFTPRSSVTCDSHDGPNLEDKANSDSSGDGRDGESMDESESPNPSDYATPDMEVEEKEQECVSLKEEGVVCVSLKEEEEEEEEEEEDTDNEELSLSLPILTLASTRNFVHRDDHGLYRSLSATGLPSKEHTVPISQETMIFWKSNS